MEYVFLSRGRQDTIRYGAMLGELLAPGCVVGLLGDLGAGKTCFVKGIAYGINRISEHDVTSPTFTILQQYEGAAVLNHIDAYRLDGAGDFEDTGLQDYLGGEAVTVVEWADKICSALPEDILMIVIEFAGENGRRFTCRAGGERSLLVLAQFRAAAAR